MWCSILFLWWSNILTKNWVILFHLHANLHFVSIKNNVKIILGSKYIYIYIHTACLLRLLNRYSRLWFQSYWADSSSSQICLLSSLCKHIVGVLNLLSTTDDNDYMKMSMNGWSSTGSYCHLLLLMHDLHTMSTPVLSASLRQYFLRKIWYWNSLQTASRPKIKAKIGWKCSVGLSTLHINEHINENVKGSKKISIFYNNGLRYFPIVYCLLEIFPT